MTAGADELLDPSGRLRGPWRRVLGALLGLGMADLRARGAELDRACAEEGAAALLGAPNAAGWRCDPIPFLLTETEFSGLALGLAQRAELLEAVLADLYGPRLLLRDGHLPPALVYPGAYLPAMRTTGQDVRAPPRNLHLYAADLMRRPDGQWCVLADHTDVPSGLAYSLENRRIMARVLPEVFRSIEVRQLRPFLDVWQDRLQRLAPEHAGNPGLALLTPGHTDAGWFEHVVIARALGCSLVEDGDLTMRKGAIWLKTLRGLRPVHVLLRCQRGDALDQLEATSSPACGTPGLLTAWRNGALQVLNSPGAAYAEAPVLAAFLPRLARVLTGRDLVLPDAPMLWLGDPDQSTIAADPQSWRVLSAIDRTAKFDEEMLRRAVGERPWAYAAEGARLPSCAPCIGVGEVLDPRPVTLRLFLVWDGAAWRPLPGGLAQVLEAGDVAGHAQIGLTKDVWVMVEEGLDINGPPYIVMPQLPIRRLAGDLPSRVADNFYWLGRYLERLENTARLTRLVLARLSRDALLPRDLPDLASLIACLIDADIVSEEFALGAGTNQLADLLARALAGDAGTVALLTGRVRGLADTLRDRLSGEMHATIAHELRRLKGARVLLRPDQRAVGIGLMHAFAGELLQFCAAVSGYAAENMVRGGGWLFLDLGRRIERAQSVAGQLCHALDQRQDRLEAGLTLALDLCDSALTYRARYLTAIQALPVIDLVVADEGNPRGLGFQLATARRSLAVLAPDEDDPIVAALDAALEETRLLLDELAGAPGQPSSTADLVSHLRSIGDHVGRVSEALRRRYFALLPITLTDGLSQ